MGLNIPIPKELSHLKTDKRGYPIPYFVSWVNGEPEFRFIDAARIKMIIDKKVCHICGLKLNKDYNYVISGPIGYSNRVSSDACMHRVCAEFSLRACPHLYMQKAERREGDDLAKKVIEHSTNAPFAVADKPTEFRLIRVSKWWAIEENGGPLIRYNPVSYESYHYINGKLTKDE